MKGDMTCDNIDFSSGLQGIIWPHYTVSVYCSFIATVQSMHCIVVSVSLLILIFIILPNSLKNVRFVLPKLPSCDLMLPYIHTSCAFTAGLLRLFPKQRQHETSLCCGHGELGLWGLWWRHQTQRYQWFGKKKKEKHILHNEVINGACGAVSVRRISELTIVVEYDLRIM